MITLDTGLDDLSKELGETTTNTNVRRVGQYGDAVVEFFNERKWPFAIKKNISITTTTSSSYAIPASVLEDGRWPGAIKEIYLGTATDPIVPIDYDKRGYATYQGKNFFYTDPENTAIYLLGPVTAGQVITIHYYYVPTRLDSDALGDALQTYPLPDRYRKAVATLAAAYVQWSRYLEGPGNRLYNVYKRMIGEVTDQQAEQPSYQPRRLPHPLAWRGFRRSYP